MNLKERIQEDMKAAMRAKDQARLSALRLLLAAVKQREVDERIELADAGRVGTSDKMVKQRREASAEFGKAARPDLAVDFIRMDAAGVGLAVDRTLDAAHFDPA